MAPNIGNKQFSTDGVSLSRTIYLVSSLGTKDDRVIAPRSFRRKTADSGDKSADAEEQKVPTLVEIVSDKTAYLPFDARVLNS